MKVIKRASIVLCLVLAFVILTAGNAAAFGDSGLKALGAAIAIADSYISNVWFI